MRITWDVEILLFCFECECVYDADNEEQGKEVPASKGKCEYEYKKARQSVRRGRDGEGN